MMAEFRHALRRLKGQTIGWSIGIGLYGIMMVYLYPMMADLGDVVEEFMSMFPPAMMAFFENMYRITTPVGFIDVYYFSYLHLIIGILAISAGAGLVAADEERGVLDLIMAHPISRTALFLGRWLALVVTLVIILVVGWLTWAIPANSVGLELTAVELLLPFLPLLAILLFFASLATMMSMLTPSARFAGMITGALLVGNYLLRALGNIIDRLEKILTYTPMRYYQAGEAIEGLNVTWLLGLLAGSVVLLVAGLMIFQKRDIRVSGERSWSIAIPGSRKNGRQDKPK